MQRAAGHSVLAYGYRVHIYDRFGQDRAGASFEFGSDADAIAFVEEHSMGHLMELWQGERLVKRFEARETPPPLPPEYPE
jgi:hypothetical protein